MLVRRPSPVVVPSESCVTPPERRCASASLIARRDAERNLRDAAGAEMSCFIARRDAERMLRDAAGAEMS